MARTFLQILPLALAASLNPTALAFELVIIGDGASGRRDCSRFLAGAVAFLTVLGLLVMLVFRHTVLPSDHHRNLSAAIDVALGLAIILLVLRSGLRRRPARKASTERRRPYMLVGFAFMAVNTSTNIPFAAASKEIADAGLITGEAAMLFVLLVAMTVWMIALPVILSYLAPGLAGRFLERMGRLMERYGAYIVRGSFLLAGFYLVGKGTINLVS